MHAMTVFFFIIFRVLRIYDTRKMALLNEETMQRHCAAAYLRMDEKQPFCICIHVSFFPAILASAL